MTSNSSVASTRFVKRMVNSTTPGERARGVQYCSRAASWELRLLDCESTASSSFLNACCLTVMRPGKRKPLTERVSTVTPPAKVCTVHCVDPPEDAIVTLSSTRVTTCPACTTAAISTTAARPLATRPLVELDAASTTAAPGMGRPPGPEPPGAVATASKSSASRRPKPAGLSAATRIAVQLFTTRKVTLSWDVLLAAWRVPVRLMETASSWGKMA
mmetsp:Transcript_89957/g.201088  ORF Transcript_89957/g.201088 Transcript_89957/m.201088 type:complete len:216 (-) Transcript_89957:658-1305(-)